MFQSKKRIQVLSLGALTALGLPCGAQQLLNEGRAPTSVLKDSFGTVRVDGGLYQAGPDYRARFDAGGMEFVPALGRRAPHVLPLRFSAESVRRGSERLEFVAAEPTVDGNRIRFARAEGLVERFDARADGIELSYRIDQPIGASGDLVVRGRIATDLVATDLGPGRGLEFEARGLGGVRIGAVTGIDARGRRAAGSLRLSGDRLEMVLPAAFVDTARYPIVLDPLVSTFNVNTSSADDTRVDVAWNRQFGRYIVVWQRELAADSVDIRAQRLTSSGSILGGLLLLKVTGVNLAPSVGNTELRDEFVVAWQTATNLLGPYDIECRAVSAVNGAFSTSPVPVATGFAEQEVTPVVGGNESSGGGSAAVVWTSVGNGLRGATVSPNAPPTPPTVGPVLTITSSPADAQPAITKSGGFTENHCIAWSRSGVIRAQCWDTELAGTTTGVRVVGSGSNPAIDGNGVNFTVVWEADEATGSTRDILGAGLTRGGSVLSQDVSETPIAATPGVDESDPAVGYLGAKALVGWTRTTGFLASDIRILGVDPDSVEACGVEFTLVGNQAANRNAAIVSQLSSGSNSDDGLVAYSSSSNTAPFEGDLHGALFSAVGAGGPITNVGGGCGVPGTFGVSGVAALTETIFLDLLGAEPAVSLAALHVGVPGNHVPCGTCLLVDPLFTVGVPIAGGGTSIPVSLGCSTDILNVGFDFQLILVGTSASPCFAGPTVSMTDIQRVVIGT